MGYETAEKALILTFISYCHYVDPKEFFSLGSFLFLEGTRQIF
jgi:hypothetical protein